MLRLLSYLLMGVLAYLIFFTVLDKANEEYFVNVDNDIYLQSYQGSGLIMQESMVRAAENRCNGVLYEDFSCENVVWK